MKSRFAGLYLKCKHSTDETSTFVLFSFSLAMWKVLWYNKHKIKKEPRMKKRIYIEIGNICNLACSFCPSLRRERRQMTVEEFRRVMEEATPLASEIYLHLMGEPLLHPELDALLSVAEEFNVPVCVTTNGFLLPKRGEILLQHEKIIKKVNISLQSYEANRVPVSLKVYLEGCISFARVAAENGIYSVFRLWNFDSEGREGANTQNDTILSTLKANYPEEWQKRSSGFRIGRNTFLECAEIFEWPCESEAQASSEGHCHGLIDQIGILADGTVVPCCLDSEGAIALGNVFTTPLREILQTKRAREMERGLRCGIFTEPLCQNCTYARRFSK